MKMRLSKAKSPGQKDYILVSFLIMMALSSLLAIYASFGIIGTEAGWGYIAKQTMWFVFGFITFGGVMYLGNDSLLKIAKMAYWFLMGCLVVLVFAKLYLTLFGTDLPLIDTVNGATSWFSFPFLGNFQPSEFIKIVLIVLVGGIIEKHNESKVFDSYEQDVALFIEIAKWVVPALILIFIQPDTGIVIIILASLLVMVLCSGIKKQWFIILAIIIGVALAGFFYLYFNHFDFLNQWLGGDQGYKLKRINAWLNPEASINGDSHQLYMALLALGSAGLRGHGAGLSLVPIPEAQTDFIFAVIGQSWGFIGTIFIVLLCLGLNIHLCRVAMNSNKMFEKYIIIGIVGMLIYQQLQNIGMIVGLLPITGITLPLISYGGSSLLSYFIAFGIIMNASSHDNKKYDA